MLEARNCVHHEHIRDGHSEDSGHVCETNELVSYADTETEAQGS